MRIDYLFLKHLTNVMKDKSGFVIDIEELMDNVKEKSLNINDEDYLNKFFGHLLLLNDNNVIEQLTGNNMGITYDAYGNISCKGGFIRLTSSGYDFAEMLNKNDFFEKVKKLSIAAAIYLSKIAVQKGIDILVSAIKQ